MKPWYVLFIFLAVSCAKYSLEIESALKLAGDNREELEKVLDKYRRPKDRLKLRAAEFLIINMPYHYTSNSALLDTFRCHLVSQERSGFSREYEYQMIIINLVMVQVSYQNNHDN